ncbi:hypothetical protein PF005_g4676 [Phytophthora fragariae]|uniref:Uncharacterized protein n=1 Tax=Phytophthora fragariae TaxID=53985 RepID=A0A6A3U0Y7_9STRA|nr:hypothetical protein PF003_g14475 [Phytophthora fragariae]KAE9108629.1 hypothetical protein PF007_g12586 [Phytophthora fragariae]KAE9143439.1 hypothetical protein PF006_g11532 [Phytophthora fragariae]KAE9226693.1 hypothetical protein PF002_g14037 [Phytophthora fragariae]KAE9227543.1 hypothetical protein PF005_g4676 [Phytophthora fragariae]
MVVTIAYGARKRRDDYAHQAGAGDQRLPRMVADHWRESQLVQFN